MTSPTAHTLPMNRSPIAQKIAGLARGQTAVFDWPATGDREAFAARVRSLSTHAQRSTGAVYRTESVDKGVRVERKF